MFGLLQVFQILAGLLPFLHETVQLVEAIHGPSNGTAKLATATTMAETALSAAGATVDQLNQLRPAIQTSINTVVGAINQAGGFTVKAPVLPALQPLLPATEQPGG